jgi:UDP-glucose 4-epimerase
MRTFRDRGQPAVGLDIKPSPYTDLVGSITDRDVLRQGLAGASAVIHAATLHKPHVATHAKDAFVQTNVAGTLALLEESVAARVRTLVFTSTTSAFGSALTPPAGQPAAWVTEAVAAVPKNIYGVTKAAAESLCEMFARRYGFPVIVLRTSRFFPEVDDDPVLRQAYSPENLQANELLHRRADLADVVEAHLAALARAPEIGFGRYIISATPPFEASDLAELRVNARSVVRRRFPKFEELYRAAGWKMFPSIDRVYVNQRAVSDLGWSPAYGFQQVLDALAASPAANSVSPAASLGTIGCNPA